MEMVFNCTLYKELDLCILLVGLLPSLQNETPCLVFMLYYSTFAHSVLASKETSNNRPHWIKDWSNDFPSLSASFKVLLASCYIPFYAGLSFPRFRGQVGYFGLPILCIIVILTL